MIIIENLKIILLEIYFISSLHILFRFYITLDNRDFTKILKNLNSKFELKIDYSNLNIKVQVLNFILIEI